MVSRQQNEEKATLEQEEKKAQKVNESLRIDIERLGDLVKKQQDIIIELAARERRPDIALQNVSLDAFTNQWIESCFGQGSSFDARQTGNLLENGDAQESTVHQAELFNSEEHIKLIKERIKQPAVQELFSWSFDTRVWLQTNKDDGADNVRLADLACKLIDTLALCDDKSIDADVVHSAIKACIQLCPDESENPFHSASHVVQLLHSLCLCYSNLSPFILHSDTDKDGSNNVHLSITKVDVLASLFACVAFGMKHPGKTQGFMQHPRNPDMDPSLQPNLIANRATNLFFQQILPESNFVKNLSQGLQDRFKRMLTYCMDAFDPEKHWVIVGNNDFLTRALFDGSFARLHGAKSKKKGSSWKDSELYNSIFLQGLVAACTQCFVCKPESVAEAWVEKISLEFEQQGEKEEELGMDRNLYSQVALQIKSHEEADNLLANFVSQLISLNHCDFLAAPLWVSFIHNIPSLAEPLANLFLNRANWSKSLQVTASRTGNSSLAKMLSVRDNAFHESYACATFEPITEKHNFGNFLEKGSRDFLSLQDETMRRTGAAALFFLHVSGDLAKKREFIKMSLAHSIGLIEESNSGNSKDIGTAVRVTHAVENTASPSSHPRPTTSQVVPLDIGSFAAGKGLFTEAPIAPKDPKHNSNSLVVGLPRQFVKRKKSKTSSALKLQRATRYERFFIRVLDHPVTYPFLSALTIFALFGDDLRLAVFTRSSDYVFGWITVFVLLCFIFEMWAKAVLQPEYRNGFFFWLDITATVSLIPDIPFIWEALLESVDSFFNNTDELSLTRAGRASRAGAKAARVVRILRIVRLLRLLKLYEFINNRGRKTNNLVQEEDRRQSSYVSKYLIKRRTSSLRRGNTISGQHRSNGERQSKVGAKLAELTTRRVIMVVLIILFMIPVITLDEVDYSLAVGVGLVHAASIEYLLGRLSREQLNQTVYSFKLGTPNLINLTVQALDHTDPVIRWDKTLEEEVEYRLSEIVTVIQFCHVYDTPEEKINILLRQYCAVPAGSTGFNYTTSASIDNRDWERNSAWRNIAQTIFIIGVFALATMVFTYDADKLVISPIEKMVRIVEELAENPLTTFENDSDNENESELVKRGRRRHKENSDVVYETELLENCIKKIGGLLQVGFGEAGAEIIASNMNGSGELDPMIPGRKIQAVFGYCDIRNFMAVTEVLREEVMLYVNEIANIVHSQVSSHAGNANRNLGDSFLVVWKRTGRGMDDWPQLAEKALISFLKINVEINRSTELAQYNDSTTKTGARLKKRIPNFSVRLGFGLHIGWAIEGAIGSNRKIDASYVSPHVTLTSRLEEYSSHYGVSILFSGDFYELLGEDAKKCCRKVDEVLLDGTHSPVALYTYDCNFTEIGVKLQAIRLKGDEVEEPTVVDRRISLIGPSPIIDHERNIVQVAKSAFRTDLELRALQWELPPHFLPICRKAVTLYLSGKWKEAKVFMDVACKLVPQEKAGPCGRILRYMQTFNYEAPDSWKGFRDLSASDSLDA